MMTDDNLEAARIHLFHQVLRQYNSKHVNAQAWTEYWRPLDPYIGIDLRVFIQYALLVNDIRVSLIAYSSDAGRNILIGD